MNGSTRMTTIVGSSMASTMDVKEVLTSTMYTTSSVDASTNSSEFNHSCNFAFLEDECDLTILLSTIMFFITIFNIVFGLIANFLVIGVILAYREMRTIPSIYIASLALTDVMALVFIAGLNCYDYYVGAFQPSEYITANSFAYYFELVTAMATVVMMCALTIDRFFAIVYPLRSQKYRTKNRAIIVCIVCWIFSFCFGGLYFAAPLQSSMLETWKEPNAKYAVSFGTIFIYIIPLLIISGCYTAIIRSIWKNRIAGEGAVSKQTHKRRDKQKHKVLRASVLVFALFAVIQGFYMATFLWIAFGGSRLVEPSVVIIVFNVAQGLYHLNSLINPFLYALSHDRFYQIIWRIISCSSLCASCRWKNTMQLDLPKTSLPNGSGRPSVTNGAGREEWKAAGVYNLAYDVNRAETSTRL